jgi:hypothetical protein
MTTITNGEGGLSVRTKLNAAVAKTDQITVTQAVDLDAIEARVNALDASVILKGVWDASAGTFPGSAAAQAGESWIVSVAGTVNGVAFAVNDRIIAIADNASTTTFAANWFKADYTDVFQTAAEIQAAYDSLVALISQAEAEAGTATTARRWTAERVAQAIAALSPSAPIGVNAQTGTTYTLALADKGKKVTMDNAAANTLTIPTNASVAFPVGTILGVSMIGAGTTTVDGATGVTVNGVSSGGAAIAARYTGVTLTKIGADTWLMEGNHGVVA